ncbi:hypothetical protein N665_0285s0026 [Sinapis alba]|nr:hypothetical protein N665_0285s0026 [Sinapis alba]
MQIQGTSSSWSSFISRNSVPVKARGDMYGYYTGNLECFRLDAQYRKSKGRKDSMLGNVYEALKDLTNEGKKKFPQFGVNSSIEGLVLGGLAGGLSAYLTTPLDVLKTRLQVQGTTIKYKGWLDEVGQIWRKEGPEFFFRGSVPMVMWYLPASALTFMAVESLERVSERKVRKTTMLSPT